MSSLRLIQISDTHFGTVTPGLRSALIKSIREQNPNLIVISGDITQRATRTQFLDAAKFKEQLSEFQVIAIPGNHDIPLWNVFARLFRPYHGFTNLFNHKLEEQWDQGNVKVAMFNSTSRFRHVQGSLDPARVQAQFQSKKTEDEIRIIGFHHPMDSAKHVDEKNLLVNRNEFAKICSDLKIDLILGGHIHDPFTSLSSERYQDLPHPFIITVAGTSLSWRTRANAPNSYNQIDIENGVTPNITIFRFDLNPESEFKFKEKNRFERRAKIWAKI